MSHINNVQLSSPEKESSDPSGGALNENIKAETIRLLEDAIKDVGWDWAKDPPPEEPMAA
jgi:hypothetical protein